MTDPWGSPPTDPPRSPTPDHRYKDLWGLTTVLRIGLAVSAGLSVVALGSGFLNISVTAKQVYGATVSSSQATLNTWLQLILGWIWIIVFVVIGIIFMRWTYFTKCNAHALANRLKFKPGWSVGWYFIPIFTLWKPYDALVETFRASHPDFGEDWAHAPRPGMLPLWWALWILHSSLNRGTFRMYMRAETPRDELHAAQLEVFSDVVLLPVSLLALSLVGTLYVLQSEKHRRLSEEGLSVQTP